MQKRYTFEDLRDIIEQLRSENGCPWDKVQTHESLRADMLEEAYEAVDAIDKGDMDNLKEELGDVLMQVVFHSSIEAQKGGFTMDDVIQGICEKMVYRHPHVFGEISVDTAEQVLVNWEALKKKEKHMQTQTDVLKSVPDALPALTRAKKVQKKAADVGFDFYEAGGAMEKCVYGKIGSKNETVKPLQFSVMGAVGAQYNISSRVGIYVEPGVSYFFDDGSDIETIRKENPCNFTLQGGVRLTY